MGGWGGAGGRSAGPLSAALPPADGGSLLDSMASGMRLVVSCVSSFLVLSLLLFMVHRLRQRRRERIESLIGANRECSAPSAGRPRLPPEEGSGAARPCTRRPCGGRGAGPRAVWAAAGPPAVDTRVRLAGGRLGAWPTLGARSCASAPAA